MNTSADTTTGSSERPSPADVRGLITEAMKQLAKVQLVGPMTDEQRQLLVAAAGILELAASSVVSPPVPMPRPLDVFPAERSLPTILIVDDEPEGLDLVKSILERHYKVLTAPDATAAAQVIRESQPDVIITDLYMPGGGGMTVLESVRADEEIAQTPVLVFTGASDLTSKIRAFESGAFDYMTKPLVADEILARVRNAIHRAQALRKEKQLKGTDDLTGLSNRRSLRAFLNAAIRSAASSRKALTVAMIDQDGLKQINDVYGHHAGDDAIRTVAKALGHCKRLTDCAARLGGDEFAVVMPGTDHDGALAFIARVEEELQKNPITVGDVKIQVGASFGLATTGEVAWEESWEELVKRADAALYDVKRARKQKLKLVS